jgi:hypothetical protein
MNWLHLKLWVPVLLLSLVSQNVIRAESPAEPIIAKKRRLSYQIQPDGSKVLKNEQTGAFYRSSSGARMESLGFLSTFSDEQGNTYEINDKTKVARFVEHQVPLHEFIKTKIRPESIIGYETVSGLNCAVQPALLNGKPAGKGYLYLPYGLWVKTEHTSPDGSLLTVVELYDIEVAEPDPAQLRIPEGYAIDNWQAQPRLIDTPE